MPSFTRLAACSQADTTKSCSAFWDTWGVGHIRGRDAIGILSLSPSHLFLSILLIPSYHLSSALLHLILHHHHLTSRDFLVWPQSLNLSSYSSSPLVRIISSFLFLSYSAPHPLVPSPSSLLSLSYCSLSPIITNYGKLTRLSITFCASSPTSISFSLLSPISFSASPNPFLF
jgi:hypothetical protein